MSDTLPSPQEAKEALEQLRSDYVSLKAESRDKHDDLRTAVSNIRESVENLNSTVKEGSPEDRERRSKNAQAFADLKEKVDKVAEAVDAKEDRYEKFGEALEKWEAAEGRVVKLEEIVRDLGSQGGGDASKIRVEFVDALTRMRYDKMRRDGAGWAVPGASEEESENYAQNATNAEWTIDKIDSYKPVFLKGLRAMAAFGSGDARWAPLTYDERADYFVADDAAGGMFVPADMSSEIIRRVYETSPIRQYASVRQVADRFEQPRDLADGMAYRGNENGTQRSNNRTNPANFGKIEIDNHDLYADVLFTQRLLETASDLDIEQYVTDRVSDLTTRRENKDFIVGKGSASWEPEGITTYPWEVKDDSASDRKYGSHVGAVNTGTSSSLGDGANNGFDPLIRMVTATKDAYLANSRFALTRLLEGEYMLMKDGEDRYRWQPGVEAGRAATLVGYPVTNFEDMQKPTYPGAGVATDGHIIAMFGDFRGYQIIDGIGMTALRDNLTSYPNVLLRFRKRSGGAVVNFEMFKYLVVGTAVSG